MFKRKTGSSLLVLLVLALVLTGCGLDTSNMVRGSGKLQTETRTVSGFNGVKLNTSGDLNISKGDNPGLTIQADDNLLSLLTSQVEGNMLVLGSTGSFSTNQPIKYTLTVPALQNIELNGSGKITAGEFNYVDLKVSINGSGKVTLSGQAQNEEIYIGGSGNFQGQGLTSPKAVVKVNGSGDTYLNITNYLSVNISGSGSVYYSGNPVVDKQQNGSGKVVQK